MVRIKYLKHAALA